MCCNINYWKKTEVYMHFWIILSFLDPCQQGWTLLKKKNNIFVPWLEKFWNTKSQGDWEKVPSKQRSQRTPDFIALLQNLRGLKLVNSSVCCGGILLLRRNWVCWKQVKCMTQLHWRPYRDSSIIIIIIQPPATIGVLLRSRSVLLWNLLYHFYNWLWLACL